MTFCAIIFCRHAKLICLFNFSMVSKGSHAWDLGEKLKGFSICQF
jgi:hypothetical protein